MWWPKTGSSSSVLGVDVGVCRQGLNRAVAVQRGPAGNVATLDLWAMKALSEVRTADLKQTLEILENGPEPELDYVMK